jgi:hypothetical protein
VFAVVLCCRCSCYEHIGMNRGRHALLEWFGISSRTPDAS